MSSDEESRHITEADYRAWLERQRPRLAEELTASLPQEARDAGLRFEWVADPPQDAGVVTYDAVLPQWPYPPYKPLRNIFPRWHSGKVCYSLPSGNMVHVKPGCRC